VTWPLARGQVVQVKLPHLDEPKLFVVVSNNRRNRLLPSALGVGLTTTPKPTIPSIVELVHPEAFNGRVVCDDITEIFEDEVMAIRGGLTAAGVEAVNAGLRAALAL
jgi:mRNA interferase MazF